MDFGSWFFSTLAMAAPDCAPLVAHRQAPAATCPAALQYSAAIFICHTV
jgi:hypothetical protein